MDPDCCLQSSCQNQPYCRGLPDPQDIISQGLQSPSQQAAKSFYDRISFLIGSDSTHVIPGESPFNKRLMHHLFMWICRGLSNSYTHFMWNLDECVFEESSLFFKHSFSAFSKFFTKLCISSIFDTVHIVNFNTNTWAITGHSIKESINLHLTSWFC
jgi:hypothetical protein